MAESGMAAKKVAKKAPVKKVATVKVAEPVSAPAVVKPVKAEYVALKPMTLADGTRVNIGDPVAEAVNWVRVESWVRAGFIKKV